MNRDLSKSHVCGSESCHEQKRLLQDLVKTVDVAHQARGYKTISKEFGLHKSTVRQMEEIQDHRYLPEKCWTIKDHSKAERVIVCEVAKVPRVTCKQLKAFLAVANVNVHEPTIRRTLSNHGVHAELQEESHCSPKRKLHAKDHVDKPEDYWRKI